MRVHHAVVASLILLVVPPAPTAADSLAPTTYRLVPGERLDFDVPPHHEILAVFPEDAVARVTFHGSSDFDDNESRWIGFLSAYGDSPETMRVGTAVAFASAQAPALQLTTPAGADTYVTPDPLGTSVSRSGTSGTWELGPAKERAFLRGGVSLADIPWNFTLRTDAPVDVEIHHVPVTFLFGPSWEATAQAIAIAPVGASASALGRATLHTERPLVAAFGSATGLLGLTGASLDSVTGPGYRAENEHLYRIESGAPGEWTFEATQASAWNVGVALIAAEMPEF